MQGADSNLNSSEILSLSLSLSLFFIQLDGCGRYWRWFIINEETNSMSSDTSYADRIGAEEEERDSRESDKLSDAYFIERT